jgi:ABC-type spermidine/putrescine transport system permease subunit I
MLVNLRLLFGLLWQPITAAQRLRDRAPVGFAVTAAFLMMLLYVMAGSTLIEFAQDGVEPPAYDYDPENGGSSIQGWLFFGRLSSSIKLAIMIVLFVAVIYTPIAILIANLFERRASFSLVIREEYASVVACSLLSLAAALLVPRSASDGRRRL